MNTADVERKEKGEKKEKTHILEHAHLPSQHTNLLIILALQFIQHSRTILAL